MQSVLHLLSMIFLPPCSRWQGLKCNLEGICFHACFYKAIMPRGAAWVFGYLPTAAALQYTLEGWISSGLLLNYLGDGGTWNVRHCEAGKKANLACSDSTVCTLCKTAKKYMYWSEKRMKAQLAHCITLLLPIYCFLVVSNTSAHDQTVMHHLIFLMALCLIWTILRHMYSSCSPIRKYSSGVFIPITVKVTHVTHFIG